jgi:uncharacterized protein (TIGR02996 family)
MLMTDHDALVRAICANPDDDTPRLVYADYLEETDEAERAANDRAQVELARTPPWAPFAVYCRYRRPEWSEHGEPFRSILPKLGPAGSWHPSAFRRGLGWHARIGSHFAWEEIAPRLFEEVPIGEVHLPVGLTLGDWRRFTAADWVRHLRVVHLEAGSPVEPVRSLCESKNATGITDLHFHAATSPGLPFLVSDLLKSRLGAGLRGLFFRLGESADAAPELLEAFGEEGSQIERLSLALMWLTPDSLEDWCGRGGPVGLTALDLGQNYGLGHPGAAVLAAGLEPGDSLVSLSLTECSIGDYGIGELAACAGLEGLRSLDLSRNRFSFRGVRDFTESDVFAGLRCLRLQRAGLDNESIEVLTQAKFWPNLVELDLRDNTLGASAVHSLLEAPVLPDLTAVLVSGRAFTSHEAESLREHFGERLILDGEAR